LFTPAQLATFAEARRRTLAVAVRPVQRGRVDPRTARVTFTVVATHPALVDVKLSAIGAGSPLSLFQGTMDGVREIAWDGLLSDRRLAPAGRYTLGVVGRSRVTGASGSAREEFELRHGAIPENVAANARRRAERDSTNASVRRRNADRIAATVLLVSPAAGEGTAP